MIQWLRHLQVKRAGFTLDIEAPVEVLQKFKGDLKLEMTPTRTAKQIYIYNVKADVCCLPLGKSTCLYIRHVTNM